MSGDLNINNREPINVDISKTEQPKGRSNVEFKKTLKEQEEKVDTLFNKKLTLATQKETLK